MLRRIQRVFQTQTSIFPCRLPISNITQENSPSSASVNTVGVEAVGCGVCAEYSKEWKGEHGSVTVPPGG